jgi:hypothetical protein
MAVAGATVAWPTVVKALGLFIEGCIYSVNELISIFIGRYGIYGGPIGTGAEVDSDYHGG